MKLLEHGNTLLRRALRILCLWLHSNSLANVAPGAVMAFAVV